MVWGRESGWGPMKYDGSGRAAAAIDPARVALRFWTKVERGEGCWLWCAALDRNGYGWFRAFGRSTFAHRVAWRLTHGEWPGRHLLHSCDTPRCVNPAHLREGTQAENIADAVARGRIARGEARSRLTDADVRAIRAAVSGGATQTEMARKYQLGLTAVNKIVHRKRWAHV